MAKALTDVRSLARGHTQKAINVLAGIMKEPEAPAPARVAAATALLDRGWGKPTQLLGGDAENPIRIEEVKRLILDPKPRDTDSESL